MIEPGLTNQRFSLRCCDMSLRFCPGVRVKSLASSRKICTLTQPTLIHPTYITGTSALRRAMIARRCHRSNAARYCDCHCGCIAADQKVNRSQLDEAPPALLVSPQAGSSAPPLEAMGLKKLELVPEILLR